MIKTKEQWISTFRKVGESILADLEKNKKSKNDKASDINKKIKNYRKQKISHIKASAKKMVGTIKNY